MDLPPVGKHPPYNEQHDCRVLLDCIELCRSVIQHEWGNNKRIQHEWGNKKRIYLTIAFLSKHPNSMVMITEY